MTEVQKNSSLKEKRGELRRWREFHETVGNCPVEDWDITKFIQIIDDLQRENRRLRTKVNSKSV